MLSLGEDAPSPEPGLNPYPDSYSSVGGQFQIVFFIVFEKVHVYYGMNKEKTFFVISNVIYF